MNRISLFLLTLLAASAAHAQPLAPAEHMARFDGDVVARVTLRSAQDARLVESLAHDRWSCGEPNHSGHADYQFARTDLDLLRQAGVPFTITVEDVQALVDAEQASLIDPFQNRGFFDTFQNYASINAFCLNLAASNPSFVQRVSFGYSLQFREIFGLRITSPVPPIGGSPRKPVIFFNSLQHAREWITVMVNLNTATRLLDDYQSDPVAKAILDTYEIVIVPIVNPDGYNITWTGDRKWRKNARAQTTAPFSIHGVDNNRNWSVGWGLNGGSDTSTGGETYRGASPFSEPENQVLANYVLQIPKVVAHVDIHSYAALILRTWGYQTAKPPGIAAIDRIGNAMIDAADQALPNAYDYGGPEKLYIASGTAPDWMFGTTGCIAYTIEMDSVNESFLPPASSIAQSCLEGNAILRALITHLCPADFNRDTLVDDSDFQLFIAAYDILVTNSADLTGDGLTDDSDFSNFVAAYDRLECP
jgi:hypothetical protein